MNKIYRLKTALVFSNGSICFVSKTCNNSKIISFLEKDNKNFIFNIKNTDSKISAETFLNYKNRYLKNK
jgi:hypothetical protein